ncbi:MAG: aldo/keto reductase [Anaerolineales bacterium]|nr:aldo/keto reductase [Anaerolineales bacterium]
MQTRKLGFTDLHLTTVGLGTWAIGGGDWYWGWGPQDYKESVDTIHRALDLGINWMDSAAAYGLGRSEELIAKAIRGRRDEVIIATKCGLVWDENDRTADVTPRLKAASVRREAEDSLRRLNVEMIDLYQIHWPTPEEDIEEGWGVIADLVKEGKVRYAGVSNFNVEQLKRIQPIHPVASLQPEYSMLKRGAENELLAYCAANDIGVIAYSPLRSGILTDGFGLERLATMSDDDWRQRDADFQEPSASVNVAFVEKFRQIARREKRPLSHLAIAWVLARPEVTAAIVGARRPSQIESSAPAADWQLSAELMAEIESLLAERETKLVEAGVEAPESLR